MAEEMTGIERLREAAETVYSRTVSKVAGGVIDVGRGRWMSGEELTDIADQIEREHAEELAAAKRDMTDEAREAVGCLRASSVRRLFDSADGFSNAIGIDTGTMSKHDTRVAIRDRLCDLIEHGGKQDVDVAALRELADDLESVEVDGIGTDYARGYEFACGYAAGLVRKAIEGAPELDPFASAAKRTVFSEADLRGIAEKLAEAVRQAGTTKEQIETCFEGISELDAAADWVEAEGGLDIVRNRYVENALIKHDVLRMLGKDDSTGAVACSAIMAELDKRLMPPGMEWPRFEDGELVKFGAMHDFDGHVCKIDAVRIESNGAFSLEAGKRVAHFACGECVKRHECAVLGADGMSIEPRQTVYYRDSLNANAFIVVETTPPGGYASVGIRLPFAPDGDVTWVDPQRLTHTPPDTQERIDGDKRKSSYLYWGCLGASCLDCPALINGKQPRHHYGTSDCAVAQGMDIARREQELHARTGGAR